MPKRNLKLLKFCCQIRIWLTMTPRGFSYLEKAAKQNLPPAQFAMGEYFSSRKNDLVTAYVWYSLARKSRYKDSDEKLRELAAKMTPEQLGEARQRVDRSMES